MPIATSNGLADRHHWSGKGGRAIARYDWEFSRRFRRSLHRKNPGEHINLIIMKKQVTRTTMPPQDISHSRRLLHLIVTSTQLSPLEEPFASSLRLTRMRSMLGSLRYFSGRLTPRTSIQSGYMHANELRATFRPLIPPPSMPGSPRSLPAAKPTGPTIATPFAMNHTAVHS